MILSVSQKHANKIFSAKIVDKVLHLCTDTRLTELTVSQIQDRCAFLCPCQAIKQQTLTSKILALTR